jgi:hypothetical protein
MYQNIDARWYNNTSAFNTIRNWSGSRNVAGGVRTQILRNNISYDSPVIYAYEQGTQETHDHNSWDIPLTLTDADFISVDTAGISAPRQADGSLPDNDCYKYFLRLAEGSRAINKGVVIGLHYSSTPPDLGSFKYIPGSSNPPAPPVYSGSVIENHASSCI